MRKGKIYPSECRVPKNTKERSESLPKWSVQTNRENIRMGKTRDLFRRRQWHPTPALLLGKSHGWRSLVGCSPWGRGESDTTEQLHFHFSLSRIGEGNGNPLQCSCLENPRDGGAWWAAVYGVTQSRTQLKRLSSSSSSRDLFKKIQRYQGNISCKDGHNKGQKWYGPNRIRRY